MTEFGFPGHSSFTRGAHCGSCVLAWAALLAALLPALPSGAQSGGQPYPRPHLAAPQDLDQPFPPVDQDDPAMEQRRLVQLNVARQKSIVNDTNKLQKLVAELNAEVRRSNRNFLTKGQLHKVAEIEKLAHKVKENMSIGVVGASHYLDASPLPPPSPPPYLH